MKFIRSTLATAVLAVAIFVIPGAGEALQWQRGDLDWTVLTGHLTHWDLRHLILDLAAWLVLGSIVETTSRRLWWECLGSAAVMVPLAVHLAAPEIAVYRGLSGLVSAFFGAAALIIWRRAGETSQPYLRIVALGCLISLSAKIGWEWTNGTALFARGGGFAAVPQAHLAGALAGLVACRWTRTLNPIFS